MVRSASKGRGPNGFSNAAEMRNEQDEKRLHESGRRHEVKNTEPESQRTSPNTAETRAACQQVLSFETGRG